MDGGQKCAACNKNKRSVRERACECDSCELLICQDCVVRVRCGGHSMAIKAEDTVVLVCVWCGKKKDSARDRYFTTCERCKIICFHCVSSAKCGCGCGCGGTHPVKPGVDRQ